MENLHFLFEVLSFRLARYLRRKYGKKIGCDEKSLTMLHRALRHTLNYYRDVDKETTLIGIEFVVVKVPGKDSFVGTFLVFNNKQVVEIKSPNLADAITQMFGPKLLKEGKLLFHWKQIEDFEEKSAIAELRKEK